MASTNKTVTLELSQFIATDKPSWLTDYNDDMEKIDTFAAGVDADVSSAKSDAANAKSTAQTASNTAQQAQTAATQAQNAASTAHSTANQALTSAGQAQTAADNALELANKAAKNYQYSTTERDTGNKWTNGKKIYEKVFSFNMPSTVNTQQYAPVGATVDTVISISGFVKHGGNYYPVNSPFGGTDLTFISTIPYSNASTSSNKNTIKYYTTDSSMTGKSCTVILQYTKE
jgi:pyruvate/2-oxoglutarate dehydrogenase complex dihydrolipoamide acyltransferase (E2) component